MTLYLFRMRLPTATVVITAAERNPPFVLAQLTTFPAQWPAGDPAPADCALSMTIMAWVYFKHLSTTSPHRLGPATDGDRMAGRK